MPEALILYANIHNIFGTTKYFAVFFSENTIKNYFIKYRLNNKKYYKPAATCHHQQLIKYFIKQKMVYKKVYEVRGQTRKENWRGGERKQEEYEQQHCTLMLINVNMLIVGIVAHFGNFVQFCLYMLIIYVYYKALKCLNTGG